MNIHYSTGSEIEKTIFNNFALALKFHSHRLFPLPYIQQDNSGKFVGFFSDFSSLPSFIEKREIGLATPIASLTLNGWHLLNALLKESETRANMKEEIIMRTVF